MVLPDEDPNIDNEPCWTDNNILGVTLRSTWKQIETAPGVYDWSYFLHGLQLCHSSNSPNGKYAILSVDCGRIIPKWIQGQTWTLQTPYKGTFTVMAPWGSDFQSSLAQFIAAFGQQFDSDTRCAGVSIWAGGYTYECFFAVTQADTDALKAQYGGSSIWVNAAESAASEFVQAFPNTQCYVMTGIPYLDGDVTMTNLATYCQALGIGLQSNALSAKYPHLGVHHAWFPHTNLPLLVTPAQVPLSRYQLVAPIGSPEMNGANLTAVLTNAYNAGANNVEIYPTDPNSGPDAAQAIITFNQEVGAP